MNKKVLRIDPRDDVLVALADLAAGDIVQANGHAISLREHVPAKHKIATRPVARGQRLRMYGTTVARAVAAIDAGQQITSANVVHATEGISTDVQRGEWQSPDVSRWKDACFDGYHREDGRVGTGNFWIVVPMVFCENRNVNVLCDALLDELGYAPDRSYQSYTRRLVELYQGGKSVDEILQSTVDFTPQRRNRDRTFANVDGIKFLTHTLGCGGTYDDAQTLCGLLAGYITHPNVAGATVLSLGCQKAQLAALEHEIHRRDPNYKRPLYLLTQQQLGTEEALLHEALKKTFVGLMQANRSERRPAPLAKLSIGVECGGSDGFSGISANPAIGHASDLLVALGGTVILSEFPELAGAEQDLVSRAADRATADRFLEIMQDYAQRAAALGSGFDHNPSPGNIEDGLITDAIKSVGAAKKGGTSPVVDVLDYPEPISRPGLNLLCTPGGDVESVTAMVGSGASVILFSTGLGTPTGNPIAPVLKISSNREVARRMPDVIDIDAGPIIDAAATIESMGELILQRVIDAASGRYTTCAQALGQDDFIPWKRGISI